MNPIMPGEEESWLQWTVSRVGLLLLLLAIADAYSR
jgi:hypothetical protein